jgi:hypothetical protein
MEYDLFNDYPETPKDELEGLPLEERLEILKQRHFEEEAKKEREEEARKQAIIQAKKDEEYKEYSAKVERLFKWMIGFSLFMIISVAYYFYKDFFFMTVQGELLFTGPTKEVGKVILSVLFSVVLSFLAPALLTLFIVDLPNKEEQECLN